MALESQKLRNINDIEFDARAASAVIFVEQLEASNLSADERNSLAGVLNTLVGGGYKIGEVGEWQERIELTDNIRATVNTLNPVEAGQEDTRLSNRNNLVRERDYLEGLNEEHLRDRYAYVIRTRKHAERSRQASLSADAKSAEANPDPNNSACIDTILPNFVSDDTERNTLRGQILALAPADRAAYEAMLLSLSDIQVARLSRLSPANRQSELDRLFGMIRSQDTAGFIADYDNARGNVVGTTNANTLRGVFERELAGETIVEEGVYLNSYGTDRAWLEGMGGPERGRIQAFLIEHSGALPASVTGATTPEVRRNEIIRLANLDAADLQLEVATAGLNKRQREFFDMFPQDQQNAALAGWLRAPAGSGGAGDIDILTDLELRRLAATPATIDVPDAAGTITPVTARLNEIRRLQAAVPNVRAHENNRSAAAGSGFIRLERFYLQGLENISPKVRREEEERLSAMDEESRANWQAKLLQLNVNERIMLNHITDPSRRDEYVDHLLSLTPQQRAQRSEFLITNGTFNDQDLQWLAFFSESDMMTEAQRLMNNAADRAGFRTFLDTMSYQEMKLYAGMNDRERQESRIRWDNLGNAERRIQQEKLEVDSMDNFDEIIKSLEKNFNWDELDRAGRDAILNDTGNRWRIIAQEFPNQDLESFRNHLLDKHNTESSLLAGGRSVAHIRARIQALPNGHARNLHLNQLERIGESFRPRFGMLERILGPELAEQSKRLGRRIGAASPTIIALALLYATGGNPWVFAGTVGSGFWTHSNMQVAELLDIPFQTRMETLEANRENITLMIATVDHLSEYLNQAANPPHTIQSYLDTHPHAISILKEHNLVDIKEDSGTGRAIADGGFNVKKTMQKINDIAQKNYQDAVDAENTAKQRVQEMTRQKGDGISAVSRTLLGFAT